MNKYNLKLVLVLGLLVFFSCDHNLSAQNVQNIEDIRITDFYRGVSLEKVLKGFHNKYGLEINYDPSMIVDFKFDDKGRFGWDGATVDKAFKVICSDYRGFTYEIGDDNVIYFYKKGAPKINQKLSAEKYLGKATRNNITISGIIKDVDNGETLPFATILVKGTQNGVTTSVEGYFTLFNVPSDVSALTIGYIGYETSTIYLTPEKDMSNLVIYLKPSSAVLGEVVVVEERDEIMQVSKSVGVIKMSPAKLVKLPTIGEKDIFRSFQLMPGVSGSNESSSGLYVRGGTPGQNLVLYDGFTVYHVDHLFGMFSAFNSNAVKDIQLHKGGFESRYGGRLSSVMDIVGKDGNENNFNIGGDIGLLSGNLYVEVPVSDKLTILAAGRRSWQSFIYNDIFDNYKESNEDEQSSNAPSGGPRGGRSTESITPSSYFYDLNAKVTYKPSKQDIISYSFFNGVDDLDNSQTIDRAPGGMSMSGGRTDATKWGNWGMSTTWYRKWSDNFFTNTLASVSNYFSNSEMTQSVEIENESGGTDQMNRGTVENNNLRDYTFKLDNELKIGENHKLEFGLQSSYYNIDYDYTFNDTIIVQDRNDEGLVVSSYVQDEIKLTDKLSLLPGIRASYYNVTDKAYFEPRASMYYYLNDQITLKGAWGQYYQFTNRIIRNDLSSGSRDFWVLSDDESVPVGYSEHFIAGISHETNGYLIDVEAYYKKLDGLSEYSLQFTPTFDNVDFNEFFYKGSGSAKGLDFLFQKKYGDYNGWISYTLGEVLYDFPIYGDQPFNASHDTTHEFKIVNSYTHKKWTFAATWIYASGKPYTEPVGSYEIDMPDGSVVEYLDIGNKNNARYNDYHRLDVSATYDFSFGKLGKGNLNFSIFNFYDRSNIWYKQFEVEQGELIETDVNLLGFTPSITLSFKLR